MNNKKVKDERLKVKGLFILLSIFIFQFSLISCNPEAKWETTNVEIQIDLKTVSAGFIQCEFATNKEAYYLIACEPARTDIDPLAHQKQFMMLALDSAHVDYLAWRHELLESGEFNIAPFASHTLQYGQVSHTFTRLKSDTDYWIYAFAVDPDQLKPVGHLFLIKVHTAAISTVDVHFDYRVKDTWDYIYPLDSNGAIVDYYPYVAASCDSAAVMEIHGQTPYEYLYELLEYMTESDYAMEQNVRYGVQAIDNSIFSDASHVFFEEGETYYTAIAGCDGEMGSMSLYRFVWTGEDFEQYFTYEDDILADW